MNDIYSLLHIRPDTFRGFPLLANRVADHQTEKVINRNVRILKQIEDSMLTDEQIDYDPISIDEILDRLRLQAHKNIEYDWAMRDLRIVAYYMVKLQGDEKSFNFAIQLFSQKWKSFYLNGLVFSVLSSWNEMLAEYRDKICALIRTKLDEYDGSVDKYVQLKNHANFFENSGPLRFYALLSAKAISIESSPTIFGYKSSTLAWSFYSDAIINYFSKDEMNLEDVESILTIHQLDRTKKLLFANLVEIAERQNDIILQNRISRLAYRFLGDISVSATWAPFAGAKFTEIEKLKKAKNLVNLWYARKIIQVFFEVCVQDPCRKEFWLKYVDFVNDFRVAGSAAVKRALRNDSRISTMFSRFFIDIGTNKKESTSALILSMREKVIIEFSDTGALYVYNQNHPRIEFLYKGKNSIGSISDLKQTDLPIITNYDTDWTRGYYEIIRKYPDEGRMPHYAGWESRLSGWIGDKIICSNSSNLTTKTFSNFKDEAVFKEKAIPIDDYEQRLKRLTNEAVIDKPILESAIEIESVPSTVNTTSGNQTKTDENKTLKKNNTEKKTKERPLTILYYSKKIFDDNYQILLATDGLYIYNINKGKSRVLQKKSFSNITMGNIWIKRELTDGYMPIVLHTAEYDEQLGGIKKVGNEIFYKTTDTKIYINHKKF